MLKFENETNWANNVFGLRRDYNVSLNDDNIKKMSVSHWRYFVKSAIFKEALLQLQVELFSNRKTNHISYQHFFLKPNDYLIKLPSHLARLVFKAKSRMLDIKINWAIPEIIHPAPLWTAPDWVPNNFRISKKDNCSFCRIPEPTDSKS